MTKMFGLGQINCNQDELLVLSYSKTLLHRNSNSSALANITCYS